VVFRQGVALAASLLIFLGSITIGPFLDNSLGFFISYLFDHELIIVTLVEL
jgi:EamA domain-containing membrane protein RarD